MDTLTLDWHLGGSSIAVITLNRPGALNAMNTRMIQELLDLLRDQAIGLRVAEMFVRVLRRAPVEVDRLKLGEFVQEFGKGRDVTLEPLIRGANSSDDRGIGILDAARGAGANADVASDFQ